MRHGAGEETLKVIARFVVIYMLTMTSGAADLSSPGFSKRKPVTDHYAAGLSFAKRTTNCRSLLRSTTTS
jgi:hypothetical protein